MSALQHGELTSMREQPGRTALLYLTDRCPVGCLHCSVDATPDGARVEDWARFRDVVGGLSRSNVEVVAISGGEPFVEKRALTYAVTSFRRAGKGVVVFTSGSWARSRTAARWIVELLPSISTVYLSTDVFHSLTVDAASFDRALRVLVDHGVHVIVQVLRLGGREVEEIEERIRQVLGPHADQVEINEIVPLDQGRGAAIFRPHQKRPIDQLGRCPLSGSPTIRYDGRSAPCCNESVITGRAPAGLLMYATRPEEISAVANGQSPPDIVRILRDEGADGLARHDGFETLAEGRYANVCEACWAATAMS